MNAKHSLLSLVGVAALGCYQIHYVDFSPQNPLRSDPPGAQAPATPVQAGRSWQHFFLFGWIPDVRPIDAAQACGGAANLDSIRTQQTFLEGLVEQFAGYYVNVYAPYDAAVFCKSGPVLAAPTPAPPAPVPPSPSPAQP